GRRRTLGEDLNREYSNQSDLTEDYLPEDQIANPSPGDTDEELPVDADERRERKRWGTRSHQARSRQVRDITRTPTERVNKNNTQRQRNKRRRRTANRKDQVQGTSQREERQQTRTSHIKDSQLKEPYPMWASQTKEDFHKCSSYMEPRPIRILKLAQPINRLPTHAHVLPSRNEPNATGVHAITNDSPTVSASISTGVPSASNTYDTSDSTCRQPRISVSRNKFFQYGHILRKPATGARKQNKPLEERAPNL
ncbi:MAG: hypothetical protein Q9184_006790, partial [Pyrenodesmia sp. 2 TL-2023]